MHAVKAAQYIAVQLFTPTNYQPLTNPVEVFAFPTPGTAEKNLSLLQVYPTTEVLVVEAKRDCLRNNVLRVDRRRRDAIVVASFFTLAWGFSQSSKR